MRSLTRWPSASAGSEISADVRAVRDTGESSQPDAPETRRGRRKEGRQADLAFSIRAEPSNLDDLPDGRGERCSARVTTAGPLSSSTRSTIAMRARSESVVSRRTRELRGLDDVPL